MGRPVLSSGKSPLQEVPMMPLVRRFAPSRTPDTPPVRIAYLEKGHPHPTEPSFVAVPGI